MTISRSPFVALDNVGPGWQPILVELERDLAQIVDDWQVLQIKEKFGGLRYYAALGEVTEEVQRAFFERVGEAEAESERTCEDCGAPGETKVKQGGYWIRTLCPECRGEA